MRALILGFLSVLLVVTAPSVLAGELFTVQKQKVQSKAPSDAAIVYVVRPAFMGKAIKMWAFSDKTPLGVNKGKHYHSATVPAGLHVFWTKAENMSALELEVKAGETYYLKQQVKMGGMKARVKLELISEQEGQEAVAKCKYTQITAKGKARAAEIVAAKHQVAVRKAAERKTKDG